MNVQRQVLIAVAARLLKHKANGPEAMAEVLAKKKDKITPEQSHMAKIFEPIFTLIVEETFKQIAEGLLVAAAKEDKDLEDWLQLDPKSS